MSNVELTGAARLYRAAPSDRMELAALFDHYHDAFMARYGGHLLPVQQQAIDGAPDRWVVDCTYVGKASASCSRPLPTSL